MKQPITAAISRELGNAGDVVVTVRDSAGEERKLTCPGDCSPYSAVAALKPQLEALLNEQFSIPFEAVTREALENSDPDLLEKVAASRGTTVDEMISAAKPSAGDA